MKGSSRALITNALLFLVLSTYSTTAGALETTQRRAADIAKPEALRSFFPVFEDPSETERTAALESCDQLFDRQAYDAARRKLEGLLKQDPNDVEVLWRLSNHAINDGDAATDPDRQKRYFKKAVAYAERAVKADNNSGFAHAYLAASYGSYAMFAGGEEKVKLANRIRDELDVALKLDPDNQVAHTIYGTWHREVADVSWIERQLANMFLGSMPDGSIEESVSHLKKAIQVGPTVLRHRYELGLTYAAAGRDKEAAEAFRAAFKCPNGWRIDPIRRIRMRDWLSDNN
ncbi:MAG: tetratricopeptide repeat protein [Bacteroidota bacterium]